MKELKENITIEELRKMVDEVSSWNGQLDDLRVFENDEYFFRDFFSDKVDEAVRASYYGNYNYTDDYVRFNAYGNLESFNQWDYEEALKRYKDEIIEAYVENIDNMYESDLKNKVKKYMGEN